ncbi:2-amino-4-hydroxy-6-hydroxymethyldihydropteridine diphosphokinase [Flavobacterium sp. HSC-61S13]|uniref:2-amino-4-hydroxy-6- hydroxymethyldihydropteridine diphosphokinase n=1 Tax=Flavobacterium sp. HSC-61S13 TaxID=2910963 RepID=UPI00209E2BA6|nr:2-amino-4-hydroxy-6-hydroxymethyldihydropteridine diphosphokinase [Flavobacterium sp. HSC-61S13]MCP1996872.1 2-amino-4-hydroxy-6-hydroxymethyldihydropteridine diphosphokinase [Flavobacterium sp. HSC-61S13]
MFIQNQIILSLGSNQGDRTSLLQQSIELIHKSVGTVIRISPIYETPSWGFDSDAFYNCALLIHTSLSAKTVLENTLKIEEQLGRVRSHSENYSARTMDIDVIAFNEEQIVSDFLTVPHRLLHERRFVLQPIVDLQLEWIHPIFKKSFVELLRECSDPSECKKVGTLKHPLQSYRFQDLNFIAIEGNIGAGKTTLVHKISEDFNAKLILEGFADNPFLPKFYEDASRYAFPLEMSFLADRYSQLADDLAQFDLFKEFIIADYHIFKSLIFAQITLESDEFRLYKQVFEIMYKETPKPGMYVYLYQNTSRLLENIKKRGRSYESEIPASYLEKVNQGYFNYTKTLPQDKVLIIDISEMDFVNRQEDYIAILDIIQQKMNSR